MGNALGEAFGAIARTVRRAGPHHLGTRTDVVLGALQHDTLPQWRIPAADNGTGGAGKAPVPGRTLRPIAVVERDYPAIADRWSTLGPLVDKLGVTTRASPPGPCEVAELAKEVRRVGLRRGCGPARDHHRRTDGRRHPRPIGYVERTACRRGFQGLERRTGRTARTWPRQRGEAHHHADTQARPVPVITSPEWSGSETGGRRYAPFTREHRTPQAFSR